MSRQGILAEPAKAKPSMFRSALLILSSNAATAGLLLARNLLVARLISVTDYGIAASFAMVMAVAEMASNFGLPQQIIQAKTGDDPHFQAALQGFQLLRGVISGAVLFVLAGGLAALLGIPQVTWAYQILALVPVLNALVHFDIHRLNRQLRFGPLMITGAVPALLSLALVWPLAHWFGDWRVMLWVILAQAGLTALTSHLVAARRYRLVWDRQIAQGCLNFGWPLMINAGLLFLVFQGDKILVGRSLGMEALALFSMGVTLTLTPTLVMEKSAQNLFLPRLAAQLQPIEFDRIARTVVQVSLLNGALVILGVCLFGDLLISLLLGAKYADLGPIFTGFAMVYGIRVFKAGPAVIALARGFTGNSVVANLPRVMALPLGWMLLENGGRMRNLLWLGMGAELLGLGLAMGLVMWRSGVNLAPLWPTAVAMVAFLGLALTAAPIPVALGFGALLLTQNKEILQIWSQRKRD